MLKRRARWKSKAFASPAGTADPYIFFRAFVPEDPFYCRVQPDVARARCKVRLPSSSFWRACACLMRARCRFCLFNGRFNASDCFISTA